MGDIRIRKLDDAVIARLMARAKWHGRSVETEARSILTEEDSRVRREWVKRLRKLRQVLRREVGVFSCSVEIIREERDRWG